MWRGPTGRYETTATAGEVVRPFVPVPLPLPPRPSTLAASANVCWSVDAAAVTVDCARRSCQVKAEAAKLHAAAVGAPCRRILP